MPSETLKPERDETPAQSADRCAAAISAYIAALAHRVAHGPLHLVSVDEQDAYNAMRAELLNLASHEYDRGYRRAIALRRGTPDASH